MRAWGMRASARSQQAGWTLQLACLLLLYLHSCANSADIHLPDYSIYLHKDDLLHRVADIAKRNPSIMKVETKTAADGDYKADIMVVTYEPSGLSDSHENKARLLVDFGEHGREYISSEVGLRWLQTVTNTTELHRLLKTPERVQRLQNILSKTYFKILPMENVNGRDRVEGGDLCERKNGRGVDTNRNWNIDWGVKEKDYDPKEEFPGKAPHSEPEVQVLLDLAKEVHPHVWLNVHSGMYALFTPYDHKPLLPTTPEAKAALRILNVINQQACKGRCVVGSGGKSVGYLAHGTGTDYMYEVLKVPMSYTWEIYGDNDATYEDCFRMFNPLTKPHFEEIVELWVNALLNLLELLPSHPATLPLFKGVNLLPGKEPADPLALIKKAEGEVAAGSAPAAAAPGASAGDPSRPAGEMQGAAVDLGASQQLVDAKSVTGSGDDRVEELQEEAAELAVSDAVGTDSTSVGAPVASPVPATTTSSSSSSGSSSTPQVRASPSSSSSGESAAGAEPKTPTESNQGLGEEDEQQAAAAAGANRSSPGAPGEAVVMHHIRDQGGGLGLIRHNGGWPLLVGAAGLAGLLAYYIRQHRQQAGYSRLSRRPAV